MDPINWLAVVLAAILAIAVGLVWYGPLFGRLSRAQRRGVSAGQMLGALVLQALSAVMLAHNYARIGAVTLDAKPWLFWMQAGGIALFFIGPALFISFARHGLPRRQAWIDAGFWLAVYLATGTVFWALS